MVYLDVCPYKGKYSYIIGICTGKLVAVSYLFFFGGRVEKYVAVKIVCSKKIYLIGCVIYIPV